MNPTVLWRPFNSHVSGKSGTPLSKPRWSHEWWTSFEGILEKSLIKNGVTIKRQPENVRDPDCLESVELALYAHRTIRDITQKTAYSYPKFAHARKRLFYMLMHLPGWFHLDAQGWGADNSSRTIPFKSSRIPPDAASRFVDNLRSNLLSNNLSKHVQPAQEEVSTEGYVLHCLQMPGDYTITHHSPVSVEVALQGICSWASRTKTPLVLKPHPVGTPEPLGKIIKSWTGSNSIRIYRGNIHSAIKGARLVLVINSGTGFEALVHGKPVATLGMCDYRRATFRASLDNLDMALEWSAKHNPSMQERFLLWYYRTHVFDIFDPTCESRVNNRIRNVIYGQLD